MSLHRATALLAFCATLLAVVGARAQVVGPLVLSRERALAMGAARGPALREPAAVLQATSSVREAAGIPVAYAPRLSMTAGRRTGAFGEGIELVGGVVQDVSLRGLGGRRSDLARALERAARTSVERAQLEAAATAVLAWIDLLEAQELARVRAAARLDAEEISRIARARTDHGVAPPSELALALAELGAAELGERDAEGRLFEARVALAFAVGLPPSTDVAASGDLNATDGRVVAPPAQVHPVAAAARSQMNLVHADARLARAQATPALGVGVTFSREGTGEQLLVGTLSFPLPIFDPSRFDAARYETNVAGARANAERIDLELARDVALALHEREHTREVRATLSTKVLASLRESVRLARASYLAGTQDATGFLLLRQRLVAAEEQLGRASAEVQRADLHYALARGTLLSEVTR